MLILKHIFRYQSCLYSPLLKKISNSKGRRLSTSFLVRRCHITNVDPAVIWQTRQQKDQVDLVGLVRASLCSKICILT